MAIEKIKFGASGWRGVIADDVTMSRVRAVTQAIAEHILKQKDPQILAKNINDWMESY